MRKFEIVHIETLQREVHYEGAIGADYTLCGDTFDECAEQPVETNKRVTCERCLAVVRHVRGQS